MGRVAVSRMVTQCGTFVRASVSRLTICARALMRRIPYLYQRSFCRGRSRDSRGRGLTGSSGCTSSRASLLACRRLRGASGVCLDQCRKSVEAFCAEDPIPRLSDSLTCRQASCTHVSVFGGLGERRGPQPPPLRSRPSQCGRIVQDGSSTLSERAGEEVCDLTFFLFAFFHEHLHPLVENRLCCRHPFSQSHLLLLVSFAVHVCCPPVVCLGHLFAVASSTPGSVGGLRYLLKPSSPVQGGAAGLLGPANMTLIF